MHKAIRLVLGAVGLVGAAGCSSDRALPVSSTVVASTRALDSDTRSGGLAASMARALAEASVRHAVLQALRSSPWVEHKLVLQEFVLTSAGSHFVAAVARAQGVSEREIRSQIAALPALDFYVPSREERLTWRGEDVVRVAIATSTAAPAVAFRPDGSAVPFLSAHAPGSVLLLLHPAEPKGRRMKQQAARVGATIQDADDGDVSVQFVHRPATGDSAVYDIVFAPDGRWMTLRPDGTVSEELYAAVQRHSVTAQLRQVGADAQPQIECGEVIVCDGDEPQPPPPRARRQASTRFAPAVSAIWTARQGTSLSSAQALTVQPRTHWFFRVLPALLVFPLATLTLGELTGFAHLALRGSFP